MDNIPADDIAAFCLETPKIEPPVGKGAASVARRMKQLNWETIPEDKLKIVFGVKSIRQSIMREKK